MFVDKDFYKMQFLWSKEHINYDMEILNDDLVTELKKHAKKEAKTILELGGGNGQFAVAAAKAGYEVTVIEVVPECVTHIQKLKDKHHISDGLLHIIEGNFYEVQLSKSFDIICYWDGFGIGSDYDQKRLLNNMKNWLRSDGEIFMDVYTPWYWHQAAGSEMSFGEIERVYDFDAEQNRMKDTWWLTDEKGKAFTQSLRCYSPADLRLLLSGTNFKIGHIEPGGAMNYNQGIYQKRVPLADAMMYMVKLIQA